VAFLRARISVEQEQDFSKFLILIHELGLKILLLEQDFTVEQKMKNRKN
jgi:hypothetical protein